MGAGGPFICLHIDLLCIWLYLVARVDPCMRVILKLEARFCLDGSLFRHWRQKWGLSSYGLHMTAIRLQPNPATHCNQAATCCHQTLQSGCNLLIPNIDCPATLLQSYCNHAATLLQSCRNLVQANHVIKHKVAVLSCCNQKISVRDIYIWGSSI